MKRFLLLIAAAGIPWGACAQDMRPGDSLFGERQFIEYVPGDLPIILAAPHGGRMVPKEIPDRSRGVTGSDVNTQELARTIADVIHERTGRRIHLVICRLHRSKLDANREIGEAAQGDPLAMKAWAEHHAFIEQACAAAVKQFGVAFLIDIHGHGHKDPRVELGYLHTAEELALDLDGLNAPAFAARGSLGWIAARSGISYDRLLSGQESFGALLEERGFPSTPSPRMPVPGVPYFKGGYTVSRHCQASRNVTGLQIEANRPRLRDTAANRLAFAHALAGALEVYLPAQLGFRLDGGHGQAAPVPTSGRPNAGSTAIQPRK
jgi:N-formylglutamate amidohydrolase